MGASFAKDSANFSSSSTSSFEDIPENCISIIFMYLDPPEICNLASLNRAFRAASLADFIWESKLPSNYNFLLRRVLHPLLSQPKKEIFARLTRPYLFDHATKEVWLDKSSGNNFISISSKALKITGIDDRRYWNYIQTDESRFGSVAYLKQIWWVEIGGELEFELPKGNYSVYFRLQLGKPSKKFGRRFVDIDQVHGWELKPVRFEVSISNNAQKASSECYLNQFGKWVLYKVGDFSIETHNFVAQIKFSMIQIDCTHTKGGLSVDSVFICPNDFKPTFK
ncbi:F-box protein PP2-A14 isoform X1 [Benincasa hispida]|uniref:F-box protein PP2-A14 isoform X1 n=1 Tax=Benincasa hispida TaxID=102211 RepID=UPI00190240BB|nr:F-box protein PP2-A14 isoform X1 [Benincasa hispida]